MALPETAVLSRLGRNRFLSSISSAEQVKLKMLMLKAFEKLHPRGRWMLQRIVCRSDKEITLPGDRVLEGEGPVITADRWDTFLPAAVPGLSQLAYAAPWHWEGEIQHWEAGRK